jgi:mannosyltransferase
MSPPAATAETVPRFALATALLLTAIAAALRLWQAGESLWLDELHTAWCAVGSLSDVAPRAAIGNQSPLFFWLEWFFVQVFGASEFTMRLPSLVTGSLLPLALFGLAWRWTQSSVVGLTAAAIVAVDHTGIFYATEARPYALVQLLAVVHFAITAELVERPSAWLRLAWIGLAALLFHLHYTAALLIPAELACWCVVRIGWPAATKYRLTMLLVDATAAAALCIPALANLQAIFARRENWAAFVTPQPLWKLAEWFPWSFSAPFAIAAIVAGSRHRRVLCLVLAWLLVPATIAWLATASDFARLFFTRYLVAIGPAAIVLAAICADLAPWRWSKMLIGALLVIAAVWNSGIVEQLRYDGRVIGDRNEDWRGAVNWLNEQLPQQPYPVLVASGLIEADALRGAHHELLEDYCVFPVTSLYPIAAERADLIPLPFHDSMRLEPAVRQFVIQRGGAWLVVRGSVKGSEFRVQGSERNRESVVQRRSFGNVQVMLLRHRNPAPQPETFLPEP